MPMWKLLAQNEPIRIFTGEPGPAATDWTLVISVFAGVVALLGLMALVAVVARRRLRARPADEAAFATLARRFRLNRAERTLLRELSLKAGLSSPVAAMVSRGAFERLLQAAVGRGASVESIRRVRSLGQRLRWVVETQIEAKPEPAAKPVAVEKSPRAGKGGPARPASVPGGKRGGPGQR